MRNLPLLLPAFFLLSCGSHPSDNGSDTTQQVDTTRVLSKEKNPGELFSEFQLDSIYQRVKSSELTSYPMGWEKLTKEDSEFKIVYPGDGGNYRFIIEDNGSSFIMTQIYLQDAAVFLVVDFVADENVINYVVLPWYAPNQVVEPEPIYQTLIFEKYNSEIIYGMYAGQMHYFTDTSNIPLYEVIYEESVYDEFFIDDAPVPAEAEMPPMN